MTSSPSRASSGSGLPAAKLRALAPILLFACAFALYASTVAPGTLFGDPSEYQFIPAILGIAHPPGYAFYTLLAKLWQLLVPVGTVAFRTNLLSCAVGAWVVTAVYLLVRDLQIALMEEGRDPVKGGGESPAFTGRVSLLAPLFAALALAAAPDLWQHATHANAHVVSAALAATHVWLLCRWWRTGRDGWLAAFGLTLGLAVTHHPITLMGLPAYGLFILVVRPRILVEWRTLLPLVGCFLLGLSPLLYYPLRSPGAPFGPTDMNTWDGFVRHITARGLRVNLFHFGLVDQPDRAVVFWSLLRLQFFLPVILVMPIGLVTLIRRSFKPALLITAFLLGHLAFTLNTVQDVMAYLLLPFSALAVVAGLGAWILLDWTRKATGSWTGRRGGDAVLEVRSLVWRVFLTAVVLAWPVARAVENLSRGISLRDFTAAEAWVEDVYGRFGGQGEGAALLAAWEHLTPLWVHAYTQEGPLDSADVSLEYVSTATPWEEAAWSHIQEGPVYLPDFRPSVRRAGFRLVPDSEFYRVEPPPARDVGASHSLNAWADDRVHILGYDLQDTTVRAGDPLELILYQSVEERMQGIWMPYAHLGPVESRWTTDSRLLTTQWEPGEVVAERYEVLVPFHLPPGDYPLQLGYADLTGGRPELPLSNGGTKLELATITVIPGARIPPTGALEALLANLDNQIGLTKARARARTGVRAAYWEKPLVVKPGEALHLTLHWRALASPRDSATVFIHLINGAGRPVAGWDYTPLGGSAPTYLWFPKWLPGQSFVDPYRLSLPHDLPPGDYGLEVGMYGMTSQRRFPVVDLSGDLAGDRVILGSVRVE
jgi:hypothetical protein